MIEIMGIPVLVDESVDDEYNASIKYIQNLHENCKERHYISDSQSGRRCERLVSSIKKHNSVYGKGRKDFGSKSGPA